MRRKILIADRDHGLREAFRAIFSDRDYELMHVSTAADVERVAGETRPDVYVVNVRLQKGDGIQVYKELSRKKLLETACFFFLKDEHDKTELLGYQADGVIEKPINFLQLYQMISKEDDVIELTDLVEIKPPVIENKVPAPREEAASPPPPTEPIRPPERQEETGLSLEEELEAVVKPIMIEMAARVAAEAAPLISRYVEEHVRRASLEVAEKVVREEIDKLLKESGA